MHGPCVANTSVPKTTADNRVIITGQTDYIVQTWHSAAHVTSTPQDSSAHASSLPVNLYWDQLFLILSLSLSK